jgi:hypothetical protein
LFLYIPGIIIFLVGSGLVKNWLRMHRADACVQASVISCKHVVKKDKKDREVYNYYDVVVEYRNPQTSHTERLAIKSPTEYAVAQQIRMYREKGEAKPLLAEQENEFLFHPWVTMIEGALLIVLALEENQGREIPAMICLSLILLGAGVNLIVDYVVLKKKKLQPVEAEITDIYSRQISKETKILKGEKYTYYPVVRYQLDGKENIRRCNINSSRKDDFKTGESITLYYDAENQIVLEKHERIGALAVGIVLVAIGALIGASILSVIL